MSIERLIMSTNLRTTTFIAMLSLLACDSTVDDRESDDQIESSTSEDSLRHVEDELLVGRQVPVAGEWVIVGERNLTTHLRFVLHQQGRWEHPIAVRFRVDGRVQPVDVPAEQQVVLQSNQPLQSIDVIVEINDGEGESIVAIIDSSGPNMGLHGEIPFVDNSEQPDGIRVRPNGPHLTVGRWDLGRAVMLDSHTTSENATGTNSVDTN